MERSREHHNTEQYSLKSAPFVQELLTDPSGRVEKVVLRYENYQQLLELMKHEALHRAIQDMRPEKPLSLAAVLKELEQP